MSDTTTVYVKVVKEVISWIEVQAPTLATAGVLAATYPDVGRVIDAQYEDPYQEQDWRNIEPGILGAETVAALKRNKT